MKNTGDSNKYSRRDFLRNTGKGAIQVASTTLIAQAAFSIPSLAKTLANAKKNEQGLEFPSLEGLKPSTADRLELLSGLEYQVFLSTGDSLGSGLKFGDCCDFISTVKTNQPDGSRWMWINHEYFVPLFVHGTERLKQPKPKEAVDKELDLVGGSLIKIKKASSGWWAPDLSSGNSKRWSGATMIPFDNGHQIHGHSEAQGTLGNCAGGTTPWGTFLTGEENYHNFYGEQNHQEAFSSESNYFRWSDVYKNSPHHYGWVVEIDPETKKARKLISLGRMAHEGASPGLSSDGRPVVYMGDDANGQCLYKFIGSKPKDLTQGTLYVADIPRGKWIPLSFESNSKLREHFTSEIELKIYTRKAAKIVGGTPLDRPEDVEVDQKNGAVYVSLTNNKPAGNYYGSILELKEKDGRLESLEFTSKNYIVGSKELGFACPDNLTTDPAGNLWFTSDISGDSIEKAAYKGLGNNALFVIPNSGPKKGKALRVAVGPKDAELTGPHFIPSEATLFISVQHPGETTREISNPTSHWPTGSGIPKSSVVQIRGPLLDQLFSAYNGR